METDVEIVNRIFNEARNRGLCRTQKQFAALLGMDQSTISNALQGKEKYLTRNLVKRFQIWESQVLNPSGQLKAAATTRPDPKPDIVIPAATMELYTSMAKSIDRLSEMVERLMPGASAYVPGGFQKNYRADKP